jgi:hypothetical protein
MKLRMVITVCAVMALAVTSVSAVEQGFGLGYQGMFVPELVNGLSARGWMAPNIGLEGNFYHAGVKVDLPSPASDVDGNLFILTGKFLLAPVVKANSKFYIGCEAGFARVSYDLGSGDDDQDALVISPLMGVEYFFQGLPEVGFNWEVGYRFLMMTIENSQDIDINIMGIWAGLGAHYYF